MKPHLRTVMIVAIVVVCAVAAGALFFEPKHDGPFERLGEKMDKAVK